jgi:hypothetical protein
MRGLGKSSGCDVSGDFGRGVLVARVGETEGDNKLLVVFTCEVALLNLPEVSLVCCVGLLGSSC